MELLTGICSFLVCGFMLMDNLISTVLFFFFIPPENMYISVNGVLKLHRTQSEFHVSYMVRC